MRYKTIAGEDLVNFDRRINDALAQGWKLHGPLVAVPYPRASTTELRTVLFVREVVKPDDDELSINGIAGG